jgi:hypothetical protein
MATAQNTLSFFLPPHEATPKKNERVFSPNALFRSIAKSSMVFPYFVETQKTIEKI